MHSSELVFNREVIGINIDYIDLEVFLHGQLASLMFLTNLFFLLNKTLMKFQVINCNLKYGDTLLQY